MWILKGAGLIIGTYAVFKLGGIGIEWMKEVFERMRPDHYR